MTGSVDHDSSDFKISPTQAHQPLGFYNVQLHTTSLKAAQPSLRTSAGHKPTQDISTHVLDIL
jgi:hypothetical protein